MFEVNALGDENNAKQRMEAAFVRLRSEYNFVAEQNFACCQTCACAEIMDAVQKRGQDPDAVRYVFYHAQDAEAWRNNDLADDLHLSHEGDASQLVVDVLRAFGFVVTWNGSMASRIKVGRTI